jgi:hypothetical protein
MSRVIATARKHIARDWWHHNTGNFLFFQKDGNHGGNGFFENVSGTDYDVSPQVKFPLAFERQRG